MKEIKKIGNYYKFHQETFLGNLGQTVKLYNSYSPLTEILQGLTRPVQFSQIKLNLRATKNEISIST